jgi:hypothetical protein
MLTGAHKTQRVVSASTFFRAIPQDGDEFLNHIVRVTGNETWVSFVNVEAVDARAFTKQAEKL